MDGATDEACYFGADFYEAREKFLAAAQRFGGVTEEFLHPLGGLDGGKLFTDVAWFGDPHAEKVLVVISGTHGVEGFCGSGAQVGWISGGAPDRLPSGIAALFIHAINPYGFAW